MNVDVFSAFIGVFMKCSKTPPVRNVFELSGFLTLFPVYSSREETLES